MFYIPFQREILLFELHQISSFAFDSNIVVNQEMIPFHTDDLHNKCTSNEEKLTNMDGKGGTAYYKRPFVFLSCLEEFFHTPSFEILPI